MQECPKSLGRDHVMVYPGSLSPVTIIPMLVDHLISSPMMPSSAEPWWTNVCWSIISHDQQLFTMHCHCLWSYPLFTIIINNCYWWWGMTINIQKLHSCELCSVFLPFEQNYIGLGTRKKWISRVKPLATKEQLRRHDDMTNSPDPQCGWYALSRQPTVKQQCYNPASIAVVHNPPLVSRAPLVFCWLTENLDDEHDIDMADKSELIRILDVQPSLLRCYVRLLSNLTITR